MLIMALLPLSSMHVSAGNPGDIDLEVSFDDPTNTFDPEKRSPIFIPHVGIDGFILTFYTPCDGRTLRLLDNNGDVEYSTVIPAGTTSLVLPAYLSGEYRIEIIQGYFCFYGIIEL